MKKLMLQIGLFLVISQSIMLCSESEHEEFLNDFVVIEPKDVASIESEPTKSTWYPSAQSIQEQAGKLKNMAMGPWKDKLVELYRNLYPRVSAMSSSVVNSVSEAYLKLSELYQQLAEQKQIEKNPSSQAIQEQLMLKIKELENEVNYLKNESKKKEAQEQLTAIDTSSSSSNSVIPKAPPLPPSSLLTSTTHEEETSKIKARPQEEQGSSSSALLNQIQTEAGKKPKKATAEKLAPQIKLNEDPLTQALKKRFIQMKIGLNPEEVVVGVGEKVEDSEWNA